MLLDRGRALRYFCTPIEALFRALNVLLLPLLLMPFVVPRLGSMRPHGNLLVTLALALGILAGYLPKIHGWKRRIVLALKRRTYVALLGIYERHRYVWVCGLIGLLIRVPIRFERLSHRSQDEIISAIVNRLSEVNPKRTIFFIEGRSGSGKTTLVPCILATLMRHSALARYSDRVFYYDFGESLDQQQRFLREYPSTRVEEGIIIIDNFHQISPSLLRDFTRYVVDCHAGCSEQCLLLLSQPLREVVGGLRSELRVVAAARSLGTCFHLCHIPVDSLVAHVPIGLQQELRRLAGSLRTPGCSVVNLHYLRLLRLSQGRDSQTIERLLTAERTVLERGAPGHSRTERDILFLLAVIVALSLHRGLFSRQELRRACFYCMDGSTVRKWARYARLRRSFRRLLRSGFMLQAIVPGRVVVFHEALANFYRDRFAQTPEFTTVLGRVLSRLLRGALESEDYLLAWLYAVDIGDIEAMTRSFPQALLRGNFGTMLKHVRTVTDLGPSAIAYQLGVLSEKVGNFDDSRTHLRAVLRGGQDRDLAQKARIQLIEAEHGSDSMAQLEEIRRSDSSALVRLLTSYWICHLRCHDGVFDLPAIADIADTLADEFSVFLGEDSYTSVHLARRVYFDMLRFYYLSGAGDQVGFSELKSHRLRHLLSTVHPQYPALVHKFIYAHHLHYDLLSLAGIYRQQASTAESETAALRAQVLSDPEEIAELALQHYRTAVREFETFGDKTADYVRGRIVEVQLAQRACDFGTIERGLHRYTGFIEGSGFTDMLGYAYVYWFKFFFLKGLHGILTEPDRPSVGPFDETMVRAGEFLERAKNVHQRLGNGYGEARCSLLQCLFDFLRNKDRLEFFSRLEQLRRTAFAHGYLREAGLVAHLLSSEDLSVSKLVEVVKYYPTVHQ